MKKMIAIGVFLLTTGVALMLSGCEILESLFGDTNSPPSTPQLSSPLDKTASINLSPALEWSASTDSDGDGVTYDVYLDQNASPITCIALDLSSTTYQVSTDLSSSTTYYWKVIAKDGKGGTASSGTWSFTTRSSPIYSTDFSSDPGWTTSDPSRFYWSSGQQAYYMNRININGGGNYAVKDLGANMAGRSFSLEWDIEMVSPDYACDLRFGLFDTDMNAQENGSYIWVLFTNEDRGYQVLLCAMGADDVYYSVWTAGPQYSINTWYHVVLSYDGSSGQVLAEVTNRDTGMSLRTLEMTCSNFASDMDRVGISDIRTGSYQVPGAQASGYVDNVELYVY